ncbi:hypothetical protein [Planococcus kocurii]|uniref:hypothetical protein n=1 Tax=Planococcus kocurii TaxID=1374 RepID=UPI000B2BAC5B|nr:hypothetical protein [Planococcus kocurii]
MVIEDNLKIADRWTTKVNDKDVKAVLEISDLHVELVGPRAAVEGHDILRKWIEELDVHMETQHQYVKGMK